MVGGLCLENFNQIPKIYNLMMLLRISAISVSMLCLQSSTFLQSLLLIFIEVSFLGFVAKYQSSARALRSRVIFWARVLESTTLALYGLVCVLYSFNSKSMDSLGKIASYPAFVIFGATMGFEYFALGFSIFKAVKQSISPEEQESGANSNQKQIKMDKIDKNQKEFLSYWSAHPFIVINQNSSPSDEGHGLTKIDKLHKAIFNSPRRKNSKNHLNRKSDQNEGSDQKPHTTQKTGQRSNSYKQGNQRDAKKNPFTNFQRKKRQGLGSGIKSVGFRDQNSNPNFCSAEQRRLEEIRGRKRLIYF